MTKCNNKVFVELTKEKQELNKRIEKLYSFMYEDDNELSDSHMNMLRVQISIMESYCQILITRIEDLDV